MDHTKNNFDRLLAVQYALLTKIAAIEAKERSSSCPQGALNPQTNRTPIPPRDEPLNWERIHLASSARIAGDMARQRGVDPELSAIACALHDIGRIVTGKQAGHAPAGEEPARKLLEETGLFSDEEIFILTKAVAHHSDKDLVGPPIEEIVKDADVVDCFEFGLSLPRPEQQRRYELYLKQRQIGEPQSPVADTMCTEPEQASDDVFHGAPDGGSDDVFHGAPSAAPSSFFPGIDPCHPALQPTENTNGLTRCLTLLKILGVDDAKIIHPDQVITAPWTRFKCQYGCGSYGKSLCCPPYTPDDAQTRSILNCYSTAILFHRTKLGDLTGIAQKAMRQLFLDGYHKAAAFGSGSCRLCKECDLKHCRFPEKAIPSMEACGIDVFGTARSCGYQIHTLGDRDESMNFFGLLLVE